MYKTSFWTPYAHCQVQIFPITEPTIPRDYFSWFIKEFVFFSRKALAFIFSLTCDKSSRQKVSSRCEYYKNSLRAKIKLDRNEY